LTKSSTVFFTFQGGGVQGEKEEACIAKGKAKLRKKERNGGQRPAKKIGKRTTEQAEDCLVNKIQIKIVILVVNGGKRI